MAEQVKDTAPDASKGRKTARAEECCGGQPHRRRNRREYVYSIEGHNRELRQDHLVIRTLKADESFLTTIGQQRSYLCLRGHWTEDFQSAWRFGSEREVDRMVERLNSGMPVFPQRAIALAASLGIVLPALASAIAAWITAIKAF